MLRSRARRSPWISAAAAVAIATFVAACGPSTGRDDGDGGGSGDGGTIDGPPPCVNLECLQVTCPGGGTTRLTGTIYTPKGDLPLPNVTVYVPNADLLPLPEGVTCERCDGFISGAPLVRTVSDVDGTFALDNVPVGSNIPLVIQTGKWRRLVTVPGTDACVDNFVSPALTRLPRNKSEGNLPRIALTTGGADAVECLLRKVGIDDSEFTREEGTGRVNFYNGRSGSSAFAASLGGQSFTAAPTFWDSLAGLSPYDVVLHSCEGFNDANNKSANARQALMDYTALGGRVFMSHYHNWWLRSGPAPWPTLTSSWRDECCPSGPITVTINTAFDRGRQLADWLLLTGASTVLGQIPVVNPRATMTDVNTSLGELWATGSPSGTVRPQYVAFNTPLSAPEEERCGRVVFSDLHVSGGSGRDTPGQAFPNGCTTTDLLPQEKALIYMFFDITGCIDPPIP